MRYLWFLFIFLLFIQCALSSEKQIVINEFSIEPEQKIELWNNSSTPIDVSNWYLDDSGGTTYFTIPLSTVLYPNSCVMFSDNFNLNKSSADTVRLFDST